MADWLKYFCLGFFSNKLAWSGRNRNFCNFILSFALALVFLFCGLLSAYALPFSAFYQAAASYRAEVKALFDKYNMEIRGGKLCCDTLVNTFSTTDGGTMPETEGLDFIIDTRSKTTFSQFRAYYLGPDGTELEPEAFLALSEGEREGFSFCVDYIPKALELDDALIGSCEEYLSATTDERVAQAFAELKNSKESDAEAYRRGVYVLCISSRYPDMKKYEPAAGAPLLRTYYSRTYASGEAEGAYLVLLDDVLTGKFTSRGTEISFYGLYSSADEGKITGADADAFILAARKDTLSAAVSTFLNNLFLYLPLLAIIPLFCALLLWIADRVRQRKRAYIDELKIVGAFLLWAALFTALIVAACSFYMSANIATALPIPLLFAIVALRTAVFLFMDKRKVKTQPPTADMVPTDSAEETHGGEK